MAQKYTKDELNQMSEETKDYIILGMQEQLEQLNSKMEELVEQIRIMNQNRFGRKTEKLSEIDGQLTLFNEAEVYYDESDVIEADIEEVKSYKRKKQKGKREADLSGLPKEEIHHALTDAELDQFYGVGEWRRMPSEEFLKLRFIPAQYIAEKHIVDVAVGTGGYHQDEFLRGNHKKGLFRNSIATPSLVSSIINAKYVNALPLNRIEQDYRRFGLDISRQTMANWIIFSAERYFAPLWERFREVLLTQHVTQADETTFEVVNDGRSAGTKSYMWVHRSGEFYKEQNIVLYEYQKTRHHEHPEEFYRGYQGVLVTDGLSQYHMLEDLLPGVTSANCWAHARRDFSDAIKALPKESKKSVRSTIAYKALEKIGAIYEEEGKLKDLSSEERRNHRQEVIKPLVDDYFAWVKEQLSSTSVLPKGKTAKGLKYSIHQEKYLRVFLEDGDVPIDNSASERAIRPFTIGRKNWVIQFSPKGARASAIMYSIAETAKANGLHPFEYFNHLLTELPELCDKDGNIEPAKLDQLLPWSPDLPEICHTGRR